MTYTRLKIKAATTLLTLMATAFCINAPASAGTQDDVQACRVAMTAQSNIDMSAYRLRFERKEGYRARTLHLKAIPTKGGLNKNRESFRFTCNINRTDVVALNRKLETKQFASTKPKK